LTFSLAKQAQGSNPPGTAGILGNMQFTDDEKDWQK